MSLIIPANTLASGGYAVANSLRFNSASSDYLYQTFSTPTNAKKYTLSVWTKKSALGIGYFLGYNGGSNWFAFGSNSNNEIQLQEVTSNNTIARLAPNARSRDTSAWSNIVVAYDSTQGTASNRLKYYNNGIETTSFSGATYPSENLDSYINSGVPFLLGAYGTDGSSEQAFNGYMSEFCFLDGTALGADSFGEFDSDSGIWKPIDVSGLTFGNNGFYLEFKESGTGTNSSGMGADTSGNTNHFAVNNLTSIDHTICTCTNNFCTINPLDTYNSPTITDGNTICNAGSSDKSMRSTIGISSGKWYWEVNTTANNSAYMGIVNGSYRLNTGYELSVASTNSVIWEGNGGILLKNGSTVTSSYSGGTSTYGFAFDLDAGTLKLSQNGTFYNSGNAVVTGITADTYLPVFAPNGGGSPTTLKANFGNPAYAISSGNTDANGYGNFEFSPTIGGVDYFAICTKNLAEYG
jgi:hypothetical protein